MQAMDSLQELTVFLQKNSGKILNGRCNLALTTHTLAHLNRCFKQSEEDSLVDSRSHDNDQSCDRRRPQTVMFLLSYIKKTPALKLIHPSSTLRGQVEISRFKSLTMLEIKKVPVHMLNGLRCLRHQLRVLICSRCVPSLQVLLCSCGGDMASEAPWSSLHTLNLSYNYIDHLDNSLRLLPVLKMLDLSHNELKHTRDHLESLSELAHLNLGYNHLERVPALGLVARTNLQTLVLRNNSLDNLSGLEDYSSLLELDLGNNCLYEGNELRTLGYLHNLREVNLLGNPLAFDPAYRSIVISKFPPEGASRKAIPRVNLAKPVLRIPSQSSLDTTSSNLFNDVSSFDESTDMDKGKRPKGKRAPKVRHVSIPDQGVQKDDNKTRATMLRDSDIEDTKQELEKMRQLHGADWLLALQAPYRESVDTCESKAEKIVEQMAPAEGNRSNSLGPGSSGIESDIGSTVNDNVVVHEDINGRRVDSGIEGITEKVIRAPTTEFTPPGEKARSSAVAGQTVLLEKKNSKPSIFLERLGSESDVALESCWVEGNPEEEEHELCSPLLVTMQEPSQDKPLHLFVTVRETHLEERDLNGHVTERLELKCLKSMQQTHEPVWNEEVRVNDILPVVKLTFDYIRRDRQKREYILEDEDSYQILSKTLQPFLEENRLAAATHKAIFQCLKCSKEFARHQAKRKLPARQRGNFRGGYNSEEESSSDIETWMNEVAVCPSCGSDLIVELENPVSPSNYTSAISTPTGSLNSLEMNLRPMATSSPWKVKDKEAVFLSSAEKNRSGSSTEYHSAVNSLSSSPSQGLTSGPTVSLSSSGTSTLVNTSVLHSPFGRQRHITEETLEGDTSEMSVHLGQDTLRNTPQDTPGSESNFTLPDPTIRMSRGDETNPLENISAYQHEKLRELLQENMAPFSQKYSLVPPDILDGVNSRDASGATTPRSRGATNPPSRNETDSVTNSLIGRSETDKANRSRENSWNAMTKSNSVTTTEQQKSNTPNSFDKVQNHGSRPCSEDDIVILAAEKSNHKRLDVSYCDSNDSIQDTASHDMVGVGRAGSTDSEIAVLRNNSIDTVSITSDSVFDSSLNSEQTNLANALSDAASKPEVNSTRTSTDDELTHKVENSGTPSKSDKGWQISASKHSSQNSSSSKESSLNTSFEASLKVPRKESMMDTKDGDFSNVDHRLKLYFSMSLFGSKEELACMTKCQIFQFSKTTNFSGLLVVSTQNIYIMRISREESEKPSDWLSKRSQHSIRDLMHVHLGPSSQSFQLDFNNEGVLYTIVIWDTEMCKAFVSQFEKAIQRAPVGKKRRFKGVVRDHPNTLRNLMSQVFGESMDEPSGEREIEISLYLLAYEKTAKNVKKGLLNLDWKHTSHTSKTLAIDLVPVSIVVTPSDLYLAEENHFWPLRQTKTKGQAKTVQFTLKDHHKITDVGEVELYEDTPSDISIVFFHEDTSEQSYWHISTENSTSLLCLLNAIQTPWKEMFGVELKQTVHPALTFEDDFSD
ncbi:serine/threonine-protein kinase 11-interacting protein-like isoform X2 [Acanthaster planci]|uniref:Serine/threonine-protein kinase 11-interacting protein-like isoform X2 n=1 Tax=Acanthaster planci TaxID=133434 RepID=A0A8B7Y3Z9_ACAPL|nr:serine/threonine-protein kinase 11-interacting protein-like isoform X2 [Acanthaster planci]